MICPIDPKPTRIESSLSGVTVGIVVVVVFFCISALDDFFLHQNFFS
jgi:hypothetical protein